MSRDPRSRRSVLASLAAAGAVLPRQASAQAPPPAAFTPVRHQVDAWLDERPARHRVVLDVTTAAGMPDAVRFAGNLFTGHKTGYGLDDGDLTQVICLRHYAMVFALNDTVWAAHGPALAKAVRYTDPRGGGAPTANPYNSGQRRQLADLAARGVRFMVCETASRTFSRLVAGQGGDADALFATFGANLIPEARYVSAGVVGVSHAQEYGYSLLFVG
ncbi:MAG: hypothetical protein R2708_00490 [Vicinamibacterales bacterium]